MDEGKVWEVRKALDALEEKPLNRIPRAADRSPDAFSEEVEALNELLELKMKLALVQVIAVVMPSASRARKSTSSQ